MELPISLSSQGDIVASSIEIVSIITKKSAETLGLKPGAKAYAVIKASNVMIGVD